MCLGGQISVSPQFRLGTQVWQLYERMLKSCGKWGEDGSMGIWYVEAWKRTSDSLILLPWEISSVFLLFLFIQLFLSYSFFHTYSLHSPMYFLYLSFSPKCFTPVSQISPSSRSPFLSHRSCHIVIKTTGLTTFPLLSRDAPIMKTLASYNRVSYAFYCTPYCYSATLTSTPFQKHEEK